MGASCGATIEPRGRDAGAARWWVLAAHVQRVVTVGENRVMAIWVRQARRCALVGVDAQALRRGGPPGCSARSVVVVGGTVVVVVVGAASCRPGRRTRCGRSCTAGANKLTASARAQSHEASRHLARLPVAPQCRQRPTTILEVLSG